MRRSAGRACARICHKCRDLPREQRDALLHEREIRGFLCQSHVSDKNRVRLSVLAGSANPRMPVLRRLCWMWRRLRRTADPGFAL